MGQATADANILVNRGAVELPDPSQPASAAPFASADDLLAQLAGEEIDRLLAEADSGAPAGGVSHSADTSTEPASAAAAAPEAEAASVGDAIESAMRSATSPAVNIADANDATAPPETPAPLASAAMPPPTLAEETTHQSVALPGTAQLDDDSTVAREMQQLLDDTMPAKSQDDLPREAALPIYLKLLLVLNKPLAFLTDSLRELLGKIAILTLCNSVAVLLYVLLFRRNH